MQCYSDKLCFSWLDILCSGIDKAPEHYSERVLFLEYIFLRKLVNLSGPQSPDLWKRQKNKIKQTKNQPTNKKNL